MFFESFKTRLTDIFNFYILVTFVLAWLHRVISLLRIARIFKTLIVSIDQFLTLKKKKALALEEQLRKPEFTNKAQVKFDHETYRKEIKI